MFDIFTKPQKEISSSIVAFDKLFYFKTDISSNDRLKAYVQKEIICTTVYWTNYDSCWCNMVQRSKDCHNEVIISSLQWVIKRSLNDNTCSATVYWVYGPCMKCAIKLAPSDIKSK